MLDLLTEILTSGLLLTESMTPAEISQWEAEMAEPEILPCFFDVTIPGWLERIRNWGTISIKHVEPEKFSGKRTVTQDKFIKDISDPELTNILGKWQINKLSLTKVEFVRDYFALKGDKGKTKQYTEKFFVSVKLRKELR